MPQHSKRVREILIRMDAVNKERVRLDDIWRELQTELEKVQYEQHDTADTRLPSEAGLPTVQA